jgi:hypothetical protein
MKHTLVAAAFLAAGLIPAAVRAQNETTTTTAVAPVVVTGEVLRYQPGRVLVVRGSDGREVTYVLNEKLTIPSDVQVGRVVSVHTERGADGNTMVSRVTTTSITPEGQVKRSTEERRVEPGGTVRESKVTTVTGDVISYTPGQTIVLRDPSGQQMTYQLTPTVTAPAEVQIGKRVTLYTEPGVGGNNTVARITTTTITPEGQMKSTVEETRTRPTGESIKTTTVSIQGTLQGYVPGKSLTVLRSDGSRVMYVIGQHTTLPADLAVGKIVSLPSVPVVQEIVIEKP